MAAAGKSFTVTASTFGGPGDPGTGSTGYRGDNLNQHPDSFAELSNPGTLDFSALGNLPHGTAVTVTNPANGRSMVLYKRDVGRGGGGIGGTRRGIDLWYKAAQQLGVNGLGVVKVTIGKVPGQLPGRSSSSAPSSGPQSISVPGTAFDQAGFQQAQNRYLVGNLIRGNGKSPYDFGPQANVGGGSNALFASGLLPTTAPNPGDFTKTVNQTLQLAQSSLQHLAGGTVLHAHPGVQAGTLPVGKAGGGFLPAGAKYIVGRRDQGRDGTTNAGGAIVAPGAGYVVRVGSDPGGFGPAYPIVHFTSGPYAGRTMYLGHTLASVSAGQKFGPGQVLSHTGTHGVGNATVPGWFEIGFADGGSPGPMGQAVPF